jgi:hypothetical protein
MLKTVLPVFLVSNTSISILQWQATNHPFDGNVAKDTENASFLWGVTVRTDMGSDCSAAFIVGVRHDGGDVESPLVGGGGHEPCIWWVKAWGCTVSVIVTSSDTKKGVRMSRWFATCVTRSPDEQFLSEYGCHG